MIKYPSIPNSSKAPRARCVAFDKLDGSNFRAKYTQKRGFDTFGTRTQLIDTTDRFWGRMIEIFLKEMAEPLERKFHSDKDLRNEREIIVFGEFYGPNSFAGRHVEGDEMRISIFDVLIGHKNRKFVRPMDFIREYQEIVPIPNVIYEGNLNERLIADVRANKFGLNEGVICKGVEPVGNAAGGIWQCKIKTQAYFERLKALYQENWLKYAE